MGCHGNHAFKYIARISLFVMTILGAMHGVQMNNLTYMKTRVSVI